jgi:DNA primase
MGRITTACIEKIHEATRVEEVVGEFVQLKKSGSTFRGLSPFSNEKTPSFYVVPSKQIFKDFSSGKGGSAITFLMEHEQMSYPEALRWIAKKYNIEIEEEASSEEYEENKNIRESLLAVNSFASQTFSEWLWEDDHGRAVGLSYFRERGFSDEIIRKFGLGYHHEVHSRFHNEALKAGYKPEVIEQTGLSILKKDGSYMDRFFGRVMFPIHSLSGREIGFGGRLLKSNVKAAKYLNSPESLVYQKSRVLYGLFQAKKSIVRNDKCFLVEGYTDVISLSQHGIENVVSSSGTALTLEQIRLIKRLTKNVTLIFDGDAAGLKASFRGIDLLLEEEMSVRIVPLKEGQDPDSLAKEYKESAIDYFNEKEQDFIQFKLDSLIEDADNDPIKQAKLVRDIVESIAKIPDAILVEVYIKDSAKRLNIKEKSLFLELNKIRNSNNRKLEKAPKEPSGIDLIKVQKDENVTKAPAPEVSLIKILLLNGSDEVNIEIPDNENYFGSAAQFIIDELDYDELEFSYPYYKIIFEIFKNAYLNNGEFLDASYFARSQDSALSQIIAELVVDNYELANWERKNIYIPDSQHKLSDHVCESVFRFKEIKLKEMIARKQLILDQTQDENDRAEKLKEFNELISIKNSLHKKLNRVV